MMTDSDASDSEAGAATPMWSAGSEQDGGAESTVPMRCLAPTGAALAKHVVTIADLGLTPSDLVCAHTGDCGCAATVEGAKNGPDVHRYSATRTWGRPTCHPSQHPLSLLKTAAIGTVLAGPVLAVDICCSMWAALGHCVALLSNDGVDHPLARGCLEYVTNRNAFRAQVWDELEEVLGGDAGLWLAANGVTAATAGKKILSPIAGIFSPMAWVDSDGRLSSRRPGGPLADALRTETGKGLCVGRYRSVCHILLASVHGNRYQYSEDGMVSSLMGVYTASLAEGGTDDDGQVEKALHTMLRFSEEFNGTGTPFEFDGSGQPSQFFFDPITLCVHPRHFKGVNGRSYHEKSMAYCRRHNTVPPAVLDAAAVVWGWLDNLPDPKGRDKIQLLETIGQRGHLIARRALELRRKAGRLSATEKREMHARADKLDAKGAVGGALAAVLVAQFEAPIVNYYIKKITEHHDLNVRLVAVKGDEVVLMAADAATTRMFRGVVDRIMPLSPFQRLDVQCEEVDGDSTYVEGNSRKRKRANGEEGKNEKADRLIAEILRAIIDYAKVNRLIRIRKDINTVVVYFPLEGYPGCVYTDKHRAAGSTVGGMVTADELVQMALGAEGANGAMVHRELLDVWRLKSDKTDTRKSHIFGWLGGPCATHHPDFPVLGPSSVARGTWLPLLARSGDGCETGLLHVAGLKAVGADLYRKYGSVSAHCDEMEAELAQRSAEYWHPLHPGSSLPICPDTGAPPLIAMGGLQHSKKRMPDAISFSLECHRVLGVLYPQMFDLKTEDGAPATHLSEAAGVTAHQRDTMFLVAGLYGMALLPGVSGIKLMWLFHEDPECGKSIVVKAAAHFLGLADFSGLQNVEAGNQFTLQGLVAPGYFRWMLSLDDLNVSIPKVLQDWKQVVTMGPIAFQAKNGCLNTANVHDPEMRTPWSNQEMDSAAGAFFVTTNVMRVVLGGKVDKGMFRRLLPIRFLRSRRNLVTDSRIEAAADGAPVSFLCDPRLDGAEGTENAERKVGCLDELLLAVVLSGAAEVMGETGVPYNQLLRDESGKSWIEDQQRRVEEELAGDRSALYIDFIAEHLEHRPRGAAAAFASFANHTEGAAVDVGALYTRFASLNTGGTRDGFEEACLHHFANTANAAHPARIEKQVRVCSTVPGASANGIPSLQVHKFVNNRNCCNAEKARRTKKTVLFNVVASGF